MTQIQACDRAFAAIRCDGSIVTWGDIDYDYHGDSNAVQDQLQMVQQIQASGDDFAAVIGDVAIVTWDALCLYNVSLVTRDVFSSDSME